jgi:hypothetical protein
MKLLLALVLLLTAACGPSALQGSSLSPGVAVVGSASIKATLVPTPINVGLVFNYHVSDTASERGRVNVVWGANPGMPPSGVVQLAYLSSNRSAAGAGADWVRANHPDWVAYKCDRTTIPYEFGDSNVPLDFANPAVQQWMLAEVQVDANLGYSGVGFDNVSSVNSWHRCGHFDVSGGWVQQYTGNQDNWNLDSTYLADVLGWMAAMKRGVAAVSHRGQRFLLGLNYGAMYTDSWLGQPFTDLASQEKLVGMADVWLNECSFTLCGEPRSYDAPGSWPRLWSAQKAISDAYSGCFFSNNEMPDTSDAQNRRWVIANYLLLYKPCMSVAISAIQQYGVLLDFPEYHMKVGPALGPAIQQADGSWVRHFTNLTVTVDPEQGTATMR